MSSPAAPRIYGIPATSAPVVAIFRRGPSAWWHVGRWHLDEGRYEPGAWFKGHLYPRRCDLSPDGRWLSYFALKPRARWSVGDTYLALSRLPWLHPLAVWPSCGTWTRGFSFTEGEEVWEIGEPARGDPRPCRARFGLRAVRPVQFPVERRRGWRETDDSEPRRPDDLWDQHRNARLSKPQPAGGPLHLRVESHGWAGGEWSRPSVEGLAVAYSIEGPDRLEPLADAQWADWDDRGRLLVATRCGRLEIRRLEPDGAEVLKRHDLASLQPDPSPPPDWARNW